MKVSDRLKQRVKGLSGALRRYLVSLGFLLGLVGINGLNIQNYGFEQYDRLLATGIIGAMAGLVAQGIYEVFFHCRRKRWLLASAALVLTGSYYLMLTGTWGSSMIITLRTGVLVLALGVAFTWVPTIRSRLHFDQTFFIVFKAFFTALFFGGVIMLGGSLIIGATDQLLFNISYRAYPHTANIIFVLFSPMYFLSMIPRYHIDGKEVEENLIWSRFLEILVSYIVIPLVSLFTLILILYILLNIRQDFWTDNLLEPMLVTYSILVIFLYLLSGTINNKPADLFKKIFPKVLVPIVAFQTLASILKVQEQGLTHGRYFVIVYGIFAIASGVIFSVYKSRKNGIVALLLVLLSLLSTIPPLDGFSVSRRSQVRQLETLLEENEMLMDGEIQRVSDIPQEERRAIRSTLSYLAEMNYTEDLAWIPEDFNYYRDFEEVFGFSPDELENGGRRRHRSFQREYEEALEIGRYDYMLLVQFSSTSDQPASKEVILNGEAYHIGWDGESLESFFLKDSDMSPELLIPMEDITQRLLEGENGHRGLSPQEATFYGRMNNVDMAVVVNHLDIQQENQELRYNGEAYILVGTEE